MKMRRLRGNTSIYGARKANISCISPSHFSGLIVNVKSCPSFNYFLSFYFDSESR